MKGQKRLRLVAEVIEDVRHRGLEREPDWIPCSICRDEAAKIVLRLQDRGVELQFTEDGKTHDSRNA